jgi:hypothetical protein
MNANQRSYAEASAQAVILMRRGKWLIRAFLLGVLLTLVIYYMQQQPLNTAVLMTGSCMVLWSSVAYFTGRSVMKACQNGLAQQVPYDEMFSIMQWHLFWAVLQLLALAGCSALYALLFATLLKESGSSQNVTWSPFISFAVTIVPLLLCIDTAQKLYQQAATRQG